MVVSATSQRSVYHLIHLTNQISHVNGRKGLKCLARERGIWGGGGGKTKEISMKYWRKGTHHEPNNLKLQTNKKQVKKTGSLLRTGKMAE